MRYSTSNNNQLASTSQAVGAVGYDAAGNVLYDGVNVYLYDGEGRICAVYAYTTPESMTQYVYDAEGDRVAKWAITSFSCNISSNGNAPSNAFILGQGGEQLDETDGLGNELHSNTFGNGRLLYTYDANFTEWGAALSDWLGTKRIQVDPDTVTNLTTFTSLPFGNGLTSSGYGEDSTDLHFTGKPHDWESTNDYFGARYYGSTMGRFLSPDPANAGAEPTNPQSWNMYSYVVNNPLAFVDPTGLWLELDCTTAEPDTSSFPNNETDTVVVFGHNGHCQYSDNGLGNYNGYLQPQPQQQLSFNLPERDPNNGTKPNVFQCGAAAAQGISPAAGLSHIPGLGSGVGGFVANAVGSNAFSAATDLITSFGSGTGGGHSVFYNMGQAEMAGPTQGFGAVFGNALEGTPFASGPVDAAMGAVFGEYATGVGEVKLGYDFLTYAGSVAGCAAGIIH